MTNNLNYKLKIVDNFLENSDFKELCNLHIEKEFKGEFKVYHNEINNDKIIKSSINESLLKKIHKDYFSKAFEVLKELSPEKSKLYEYSDFTIVITKKKSKFPIHDDTPNKLLSGVIYLYPENNAGTIFYNDDKGSNKTYVDWKPNRAVFFSRKERETWHSYEGDGINDRIVLVYNLMTSKIREVYKIENKNYLIGNARYKLNPYIFKYFKNYI
jgi:hypothetical protein|tara:strand:+ start:60 stop:701 length:642 start_codon:yes stop_codon:yes gene_type:complete